MSRCSGVSWHSGDTFARLGCLGPCSPAGARARLPSEPRGGRGSPAALRAPARLRWDGAGTGSACSPAPCGTCCPQTPARGRCQPRGGCGDTAATPRHLTRLPAPQPGHRDGVPHCGTSALPQHGDARAEAAGSPQPCQCPRAALTAPRSPAAAAALGDAPQPEPSAHLHRPHRPPGGVPGGTSGNVVPWLPGTANPLGVPRNMPGVVVLPDGFGAGQTGRCSQSAAVCGRLLPAAELQFPCAPAATAREGPDAAPSAPWVCKAIMAAPPPSAPGEPAPPPPPLQYSLLLQHLVGDKRQPRVWDPAVLGGIPCPPKSEEQKMVERVMESCPFKAALACVGGAAAERMEPGSCGVVRGSLWRREMGGWRRGCSPRVLIFLLNLLQCLSHVPGRDLCLPALERHRCSWPFLSTGSHKCP